MCCIVPSRRRLRCRLAALTSLSPSALSCAQNGGFVEVYLSTPIQTCEERDRKGLYKKARKVRFLVFSWLRPLALVQALPVECSCRWPER